jgi:AhpC/TSA family
MPGRDLPRLQDELDQYKREASEGASPGDITEEAAAAAEARLVSKLGLRPLGVGDHAPAFELPNARGRTVRLGDLLGRGPVVLTFYRGVW